MIDIFDLGLRIRNVRKAHNLTQEQLAEKIKVSPHYVYELEHGYKSMSIYTLANIATVLDAPLDFLVFGKEPATTPENKDYITHDDLDRLVERRVALTSSVACSVNRCSGKSLTRMRPLSLLRARFSMTL